MTIKVYSITSSIHNQDELNKSSVEFLDSLRKESGTKFEYYGDDFTMYNADDLNFIFIRTGGSEGKFKELYPSLKAPYYLLTTGENNSLAASMEILSFLREKGEAAEIIHGNINYLAKRITEIATIYNAFKTLDGQNFGVVGQPSDWLIASKADYTAIKKKLGVNMVDISMDEFFEEINKNEYPQHAEHFLNSGYHKPTMQMALYIYGALYRLVIKYRLSALTVRCFDLLGLKHNTSCLALAILNKDGVTAACEGDVPAMLTMAIARALTGKSSFQANPSRIDVENNEVTFAHCTIPFDMLNSYKFDTHFESGLGVAIKGELPTGVSTIFKTSGNLGRYFVSGAVLEKNLSNPNLCRTQIVIKPRKSVEYFLKDSIGNHHVILSGNYESLIDNFFTQLNSKI